MACPLKAYRRCLLHRPLKACRRSLLRRPPHHNTLANAARIMPNALARSFAANAANRVWAGDIGYAQARWFYQDTLYYVAIMLGIAYAQARWLYPCYVRPHSSLNCQTPVACANQAAWNGKFSSRLWLC